MTAAQIVNWTALGLTVLVVIRRGRWPERLGMALIVAAFVATPFAELRDSWYRPQFGILAVDATLLAALIVTAFRYDRDWTICAAAFQAVTVLTHFAFMIDPRALYRAFYFGNFAMGYLLLGAILGGAVIEGPRPYRLRSLPRPRRSWRSGSS
jgi:hypothetical protein